MSSFYDDYSNSQYLKDLPPYKGTSEILKVGDIITNGSFERMIVTVWLNPLHDCPHHQDGRTVREHVVTDTDGRVFYPVTWCRALMAGNLYEKAPRFRQQAEEWL